MTAIIEKIISFVAPHHCISCGNEDNVWCAACRAALPVGQNPVCVFCTKPTVDWQVCDKCRKQTKLDHVWVASLHEGDVAELLRRFKFERVKAAAEPLAALVDERTPFLGDSRLIVPLPTAPDRVRQRGYDQTLLLARQLAKERNLSLATPLLRRHNLRQVGSDRKLRQQNAKTAYELAKPESVRNKQVVLIDDICTTGASLAAAARLIKRAGAVSVSATVVAWRKPQK